MAQFTHQNPEAIARALSLTGGGVRGLFTATILSGLEGYLGRDLSGQFDVIVGTSVGGIIALGLSCGISARSISEHIFDSAPIIFGGAAFFNPKGLRVTRHRPTRLRECISNILGSHRNVMIRDLDRNVLIPTVDALDNRMAYFSNVERIGSTPCLNATLLDVALATSAAPTYFPAHAIGERKFLDGGIASNNPDIEALGFCTAVLSRPPSSSLLLSVGTGQVRYAVDRSDSMDAGALKWITRYKIVDRILSLQEDKSAELVSGLLGDRYLRIDTVFDREIELDDCSDLVLALLKGRAMSVIGEKWKADPQRVAHFVR